MFGVKGMLCFLSVICTAGFDIAALKKNENKEVKNIRETYYIKNNN